MGLIVTEFVISSPPRRPINCIRAERERRKKRSAVWKKERERIERWKES